MSRSLDETHRSIERVDRSLREGAGPESRAVFEILVREHADMLTAFLRSCVRDESAVDDLFQDTFLTAWHNIARFDRSRPFAPWLRGIATKLVLASRRRSARNKFVDETTAGDLEALHARFESITSGRGDVWSDRLEALRECLDRLKPPMRKTVDLHYQGDLACPAIALRLGESTEAVKKRLQRARTLLSWCLGLDVEGVEHVQE